MFVSIPVWNSKSWVAQFYHQFVLEVEDLEWSNQAAIQHIKGIASLLNYGHFRCHKRFEARHFRKILILTLKKKKKKKK